MYNDKKIKMYFSTCPLINIKFIYMYLLPFLITWVNSVKNKLFYFNTVSQSIHYGGCRSGVGFGVGVTVVGYLLVDAQDVFNDCCTVINLYDIVYVSVT